jgi:hypothetical protein
VKETVTYRSKIHSFVGNLEPNHWKSARYTVTSWNCNFKTERSWKYSKIHPVEEATITSAVLLVLIDYADFKTFHQLVTLRSVEWHTLRRLQIGQEDVQETVV